MEKHIDVNIKARYFSVGEYNDTSHVLFVLHGYGHLARYFIRKFEPLVDQGVYVIAPEGLSRYYQEGFQGRVGASWMTKEDRLTDIDNYVHFLDTVYNAEIPADAANQVTVLGFSQGAATAGRWATLGRAVKYHRLLLWSGIFPPDLPREKAISRLDGREVISIYGLQDPYLSDERIEEHEGIAKALNVKYDTITFEGGHDIDKKTLQSLF